MDYNREDQYSLDRLINRTNAAEGTSLPPQQRGAYRVPLVTAVKAVATGNSQYVISWREPEGFDGRISQYNVFARVNNNQALPVQNGAVAKSPAAVVVPANPGDRITFFVQTRLSSGFVSLPGVGPSATVTASPSVVSLSSGPYTVQTSNTIFLGDTTSASFTIYLPADPTPGFFTRIKQIAAANTLTIDGNGHNIDGSASLSIVTQYTSATLVFGGVEWNII